MLPPTWHTGTGKDEYNRRQIQAMQVGLTHLAKERVNCMAPSMRCQDVLTTL